MSEPFEVISGPYEVYVAPVDTAFPDVDDDPDVAWTLLGANGTKNQDESGVVVTHNQTVNAWKSAGSTLPIKAFRSEESIIVECKLADLSPETYAKILNDATVTTDGASPTQPATKRFSLKQGPTVANFAVLVRGMSPAGDALNAQYQIPVAYQGASPKPAFVKANPALLDVQFMVLDSDTDPELVVQTGAHS